MSEIDPTDHALATIASILENPEPAFTLREPEDAADALDFADGDLVEDAPPVLEEPPLVPEHTDADGYSKFGPGPMLAIRLKWTVHRGEDDQYVVHETIGEQSAPVISGPMTAEAAVQLVDAREEEARQRFEALRSEIAGRSSLAEYERKGES